MHRLRTALTAVGVLVLLGLVGTVAAAWSEGYRPLAVRSGSMEPTHRTGDLVVIRPQAAYEVGDVITFAGRTGLTTHRVVDAGPSGLTTQGDANADADPFPVPVASVRGEVVASVARGGYALVFLQQPTGALAVVSSTALLMMLWSVFFPPTPGPTRAARASGDDVVDRVRPRDEGWQRLPRLRRHQGAVLGADQLDGAVLVGAAGMRHRGEHQGEEVAIQT